MQVRAIGLITRDESVVRIEDTCTFDQAEAIDVALDAKNKWRPHRLPVATDLRAEGEA